jgi:hypothetical protein
LLVFLPRPGLAWAFLAAACGLCAFRARRRQESDALPLFPRLGLDLALLVLLGFLLRQARLNAERGGLLAGALILLVSTPLLMLAAHAFGSAVIRIALRRFSRRPAAVIPPRKESHAAPPD